MSSTKKKTTLPYIAEDLRSLAVPINTLRADPQNARVHPGRNLDSIVASLERYGQRKPVVVNVLNDMVVEAGNGTLEAAAILGWTHLAIVRVKDEPNTAVGYALADNRTAELAEWNDKVLPDLLRNLPDEELIGWEADELDAWLNETGDAFDPGGDGKTPEDKLEGFENASVRQIVLMYGGTEYEWAIGWLKQVMEDQGMDTNTDAVSFMLKLYEQQRQG